MTQAFSRTTLFGLEVTLYVCVYVYVFKKNQLCTHIQVTKMNTHFSMPLYTNIKRESC